MREGGPVKRKITWRFPPYSRPEIGTPTREGNGREREMGERECPMCRNASIFWGRPTKCYGGGHATEGKE